MFFLKKIISLLLLPPVSPMLIIVVALMFIKSKPVAARRGLYLGVALLWVFMMPLTVGLMVRAWESAVPVLDQTQAQQAQAIVILGGGRSTVAKEYGGYAPNRFTLERIYYGAHLYRQHHLPILVSGGAIPKIGPSEAELMKTALEQDFAVPVAWAEIESRDTRENARYSAQILKPLGIQRVLLVSHASHLPRALEEFRRVGLEPIAAPTAYLAGEWQGMPSSLSSYFPSSQASLAAWLVSHEVLGQLAQRWF